MLFILAISVTDKIMAAIAIAIFVIVIFIEGIFGHESYGS